MNLNTSEEIPSAKWLHPNQLLKQQRLKLKKKQLQVRMVTSQHNPTEINNLVLSDSTLKRRNPFVIDNVKRSKSDSVEESSDETLFKLLQLKGSIGSKTNSKFYLTTFSNILSEAKVEEPVQPFGSSWIPIDWALKTKLRLLSTKPFAWNQKLKISEEASGITGFVRCLDNNSHTTVDTSSNSKFYQSCLFWQHPSLPWLNLFPRTTGRTATVNNIGSVALIRESLYQAWSDSLRSLFQLVRTRQCPYFYLCTNNLTVLFRSAGICCCTEMTALITPTTLGFRQLLKQEDIDYKMPLKNINKNHELPDHTETDSEELPDERWLENMGINPEDIKEINYTQAKLIHKAECDIDNTEESLVLVEGGEVQGLYNFLMNTKSIRSLTGPTAGIPPTLLAPVAFHGATLSSLKVRENKVRDNDRDYFSLELNGPILPNLIHNLCLHHPSDQDMTATFANVNPTLSFSKVQIHNPSDRENENACGVKIFGQENLSDCGLNVHVLKHFCSASFEKVSNMECLMYNADTKTYTWS